MFISGCPFLFLGFLCEIFAFIFGIIGWKTPQGKIAAIGVPCLGLFLVPGILLLGLFSLRAVRVPEQSEPTETRHLISHKHYSLDSLEGVLTEEKVEIDNNIFAEGTGSLRVKYNKLGTRKIRLFETGPMGIENRMLIFSAKLKNELHEGRAYLEMWCDIPGKGEFFSRGFDQQISGSTARTTDWTTSQTAFRLERGQMPANVKLNLVIEGAGTVWIDDIKLLSSPLD